MGAKEREEEVRRGRKETSLLASSWLCLVFSRSFFFPCPLCALECAEVHQSKSISEMLFLERNTLQFNYAQVNDCLGHHMD